jgi:hypothetical protein
LAAPSRRPLLLVGGLIALVVAIAAGLLVVLRDEPRPAPVVRQPTAVVRQPAPVAQQPAPAAQQPAPIARQPAPSTLPALAAPLALFGNEFEKRLAGWNIGDPLAWGPQEEVEGFPIAGRKGQIARSLEALPGRLICTVTVAEEAQQAFIGLRDAEGRTTGLLLLPIGGLQASLVTLGSDGSTLGAAGAATQTSRTAHITLIIDGARLRANLRDAAVAEPMSIDLPAPPVTVVLAADGTQPTLFQDLRAEP